MNFTERPSNSLVKLIWIKYANELALTKAARENISHENGPVTRPRESGGRGRRSPSAARWSSFAAFYLWISHSFARQFQIDRRFFFVPDNKTGRNFQIPSNWVASIHWLRNVFERAHCRLICILIDSVRGWSCWKIKQFQWQIFSAKIFALEAQTCSKRIHFTFFDICAQGQSCNERLCFNQNSTDGPRSITLESNGHQSIAFWTLYNFAFECVVIGWNARPQIREKWRGSQRHLPQSSWFIGSLRPNASSNRLALKTRSIEHSKSYRMI